MKFQAKRILKIQQNMTKLEAIINVGIAHSIFDSSSTPLLTWIQIKQSRIYLLFKAVEILFVFYKEYFRSQY